MYGRSGNGWLAGLDVGFKIPTVLHGVSSGHEPNLSGIESEIGGHVSKSPFPVERRLVYISSTTKNFLARHIDLLSSPNLIEN